MHRIKLSLLSLSLLAVSSFAATLFEAGRPIIVSVDPGYGFKGDTVLVTVGMDSAPSADEILVIGASSAGQFSDLPATVTVPQGQDHVSFYATLSTTASGAVAISATGDGVTKTSDVIPIIE